MAKNNIVYKEFIFEHTVSVVEHIINNTLVNIKKKQDIYSLFGKKIVCPSNWNEYLDSLAQHKEIGHHSGAVPLYVDVMH